MRGYLIVKMFLVNVWYIRRLVVNPFDVIIVIVVFFVNRSVRRGRRGGNFLGVVAGSVLDRYKCVFRREGSRAAAARQFRRVHSDVGAEDRRGFASDRFAGRGAAHERGNRDTGRFFFLSSFYRFSESSPNCDNSRFITTFKVFESNNFLILRIFRRSCFLLNFYYFF